MVEATVVEATIGPALALLGWFALGRQVLKLEGGFLCRRHRPRTVRALEKTETVI